MTWQDVRGEYIEPDPWQDVQDDDHLPCPMGCGRTTDDVAGGPCSACWDEAPGSPSIASSEERST